MYILYAINGLLGRDSGEIPAHSRSRPGAWLTPLPSCDPGVGQNDPPVQHRGQVGQEAERPAGRAGWGGLDAGVEQPDQAGLKLLGGEVAERSEWGLWAGFDICLRLRLGQDFGE